MSAASQIDPRTGRLRHLLTLDGLPAAVYEELFKLADSHLDAARGSVRHSRKLQGKLMVNAFFEPSTRTRMAFEIAAKSMGAEVVNFDVTQSSEAKGESYEDTVRTICALGADILAIRGDRAGMVADATAWIPPAVTLLNGGDGSNEHPSQGLLDAWTIVRRKGSIAGLQVAIIGDVKHSRVAHSLLQALTCLGARQIRLTGAPGLVPDCDESPVVKVLDDVDEAISDVDVVVTLRAQYERHAAGASPPKEDYAAYCVDARRLQLAAADALLLHPGPINRGCELSPEVADGPQSCILEQVTNGVAMRMAIMQMLTGA